MLTVILKNSESRININCASDILIKIKVFVNGCPDKDKLKFENNSYEYYLNRHIPLHSALYHSAELNLFENNDLSISSFGDLSLSKNYGGTDGIYLYREVLRTDFRFLCTDYGAEIIKLYGVIIWRMKIYR